MHPGQHRIHYLDGLRGVAIVMVVLYHFFAHVFAQWLPYGSRYAAFPPVRFGWSGVELFFLISGFVIFMTIERCSGFLDFMMRRWLRLFPAMLVASIAIFAIDRIFAWPGPFTAKAQPLNLIPGLTLISPAVWHAVLQVRLESIDGPFWSLYIEVVFYLLFGLLYFAIGWRSAVCGLVAAMLVSSGISAAARSFPALESLAPLKLISDTFRLFLSGWFAAGALFYKARKAEDRRIFVLALATGLVSALACSPGTVPDRIVLALIVLFFAWVQKSRRLQELLSTLVPTFFGAISYPLYLTHNNIGIGLINALSAFLPSFVATCLAIALVVMLAWGIARWAEPVVRLAVRPVYDRGRSLFALSSA